QQWMKASQPTYVVEAAKKLGLRGVTRPDWEASGDYGYQWGSAMHDLLELAIRSPETELEASALVLANEHGLGAGRVDELLATVESVRASEMWKRAQSSKRCLVEVPIDVREKGTEVPTFVRGVIDLVFQEEQGWVLVDYKTDDIRVSQVLAAREYYRGQLDAYAKYWEQVTGEKIAEKGLYFTRIQNYQVL
ncbi:MAG: PD-(D/E)XK nuclease family protein, partial [Planctomycetota bacterium]